jgi:hypothetical protein
LRVLHHRNPDPEKGPAGVPPVSICELVEPGLKLLIRG